MIKPHHSKRQSSGLAFAELLVVILVVTFLLLVLLAGLSQKARTSDASRCANNLRHLIQAWQMYADDSDGSLVPAGQGGFNDGRNPGNPAWVAGWLDWTSSSDNSNTGYLVDSEQFPYAAYLGPYLDVNPNYFKCPSDYSTTSFASVTYLPRARSVSMNNWMGGRDWAGAEHLYTVFRNLDDISAPAERWVVVEERPESINDSIFLVNMTSERIVDFPGVFHSNGTFFNFADGHVEYRHWIDQRTVPSVTPGKQMSLNVESPDNEDLQWLQERTTDPKF